jgi:eukaryotic-like serine/threonine-protein kinase
VKPGNVLVRDDGLAKISDFGIARTAGDPALTQSGFLTGTPSYFSPELARGADPDAGTDVWALGATLYAAVEGRPPYEPRTNPVAVLHDITSKHPPRPRRADFLEPALLRMMDRNPKSRWSMADAAHGLRKIADAHSPERTRANTVSEPATAHLAAPVAARPRAERDGSATSARPRPAPAPERPGSRRRGPVYAVLGLVALLIVLGGVAYAASLLDDNSGRETAGGSSPSSSPSEKPSGTPSQKASSSQNQDDSPSPTDSPSRADSPSQSRPAAGTGAAAGTGVAAKKVFLRDYFSKAPGGTDEGWALLTPRYQREIGRGSYDGFWRTIRSVDVGRVSDAGGDTVDATLTYTREDGSTSTEQHRLPLVRAGNGYLIDGDE